MKNIALLIAVFIFLAGNSFAQDLRKKAETNPLDCALYLLAKDKNFVDTDNLARTFLEVRRFDDALRVFDFEENSYSKFMWLSHYGKKLLEENRRDEANKFFTKAFVVLRDEEKWAGENRLPDFVSGLIQLNRSAEALEVLEHQKYDDDKAEIFISFADTYLKLGQTDKAIKALQTAFELRNSFEDSDNLFLIARLYAKLKQFDEALKVLKHIENDAVQITDTDDRHAVFLRLIPVYLQINQKERAYQTWQQNGDLSDSADVFSFASFLIENGNVEMAKPYLLQLADDKEFLGGRYGEGFVRLQLKLNDLETASTIARTMSDENDDYFQQEALMLVADRFIAEGKNDSALEILDFAFGRARKIVYEHNPMDSVGASSGSRKEIYLGHIFERLMKLKQFDKAFLVFNAIDSEHHFARDFLAGHMVEFAKQQTKTLPRKKIYTFLAEAQNIVKDEEYHSIDITLRSAEVYAQMGEKAKAVEMLTKVLEEALESCCYDDDFLLSAGKVFEQNKLKADANMKKVLLKFIIDAE